MDPLKNNDGRTPFKELSSNTTEGRVADAKERKRERDRARYAAMTSEQRIEMNKKRRESYQRKKGQLEQAEIFKDGKPHLQTQIDDPSDYSDWLHRSDSYEMHKIYNAHDSAQIPDEDGGSRLNKENESPIGDFEFSVECGRRDGSNSNAEVIDAKERKRIRERTRYASMSSEQRTLYNSKPSRKEARIDYKRKQQELRKNTLNQASIAMENPKYIPEPMPLSREASNPVASPVSALDWVIPDLSPSPSYVLPTLAQTKDVEASDIYPSLNHKCRVPSGERQSLLARRNQQFEHTIARKLTSAEEDIECMTEEVHNGAHPQMAAEAIQNESTSTCSRIDVTAKTHASVGDNDDDEEGVIFEEDEDEDEGYLFAGQAMA